MIPYHNLCGLGLKINSRPPLTPEKVPSSSQNTQTTQDQSMKCYYVT
jgi:hypothetical protein